MHRHSRDADALTYFLRTLLSSVMHDNGGVDERAGSGHILSQQAFHLVRTQTDGQVEKLHRSVLRRHKKKKKKTQGHE